MGRSTSLCFSFLPSKIPDSGSVTLETPSSFKHLRRDHILSTALCQRQVEQCSLSPFYRWGSWGSKNLQVTDSHLNLTSSGKPFLTTSFTKSGHRVTCFHCSPVFILPSTSILFLLRVKRGFCGHINVGAVRVDQTESPHHLNVLMLTCSDLQDKRHTQPFASPKLTWSWNHSKNIFCHETVHIWRKMKRLIISLFWLLPQHLTPLRPLWSTCSSGLCSLSGSWLGPRCLPPHPECGRRPAYLSNKRVNRGKPAFSAPEFSHGLMMTNSTSEKCF